jgi:hypothetical protein
VKGAGEVPAFSEKQSTPPLTLLSYSFALESLANPLADATRLRPSGFARWATPGHVGLRRGTRARPSIALDRGFPEPGGRQALAAASGMGVGEWLPCSGRDKARK